MLHRLGLEEQEECYDSDGTDREIYVEAPPPGLDCVSVWLLSVEGAEHTARSVKIPPNNGPQVAPIPNLLLVSTCRDTLNDPLF